jgi:sulfate adenylyltransferase subunit 2
MKTQGLKQALDRYRFDAAFGGARRDEEKSRAKERFFSFRTATHRWDPKNQRPELWNLYNGRISKGESIRVFPLSNWTELDVWQYVTREGLELPSLYFAHEREVVERDGLLLARTDFLWPVEGEPVRRRTVRFRTIGDATCTGAVVSSAASLDEIVREIAASRQTERGGRFDDRRSEAAMEDRKRQGYF